MIICILVSLVQHYVRESMLLHVTAVHFLLLCSILLYGVTTIYEFSIDGNFGCFQFVVIINKVVVDIFVSAFQ